MKINKVMHGDCLEKMKKFPDNIIDMVLVDPPYGTTACKWDSVIPFEPMWEQLKRIIKPTGAMVFTASQPFTSALIMSNIKQFKYCWIWEKDGGSNIFNLKHQPMKEHEDVIIFSVDTHLYNPQMQDRIGSRKNKVTTTVDSGRKNSVYGSRKPGGKLNVPKLRNPRSIQRFNRQRGLHPTQKPVALMEYFVRTYTNEGSLVLDFAAGSGTTGVACKNLNRNFILIEKELAYIEVINKRLSAED